MNLELIEQKCLSYLKQTQNPLVPFGQLKRRLESEDGLTLPDDAELLGFLRKHELFRVIEPPGLTADPDGVKALAEFGFNIQPCVILDTRMPNSLELEQYMASELDRLAEALVSALKEAQERNDSERVFRVKGLLVRAQRLKKKLRDTL